MILNACDWSESAPIKADLCIIGAGAAGISLALELAGNGLEVLLLESGGLRDDSRTQALYRGTVSDERLHSPPDRYRLRRLGGSTAIWGGRCVPFDEIDFQAREWVHNSGWPISRKDLDPYYPAANRLCEAGEFAYTAEAAFHNPLSPMIPGFRGRHFSVDTLERFSCPTDFGSRYRTRLENTRGLRVLLHANVTALQLNKTGNAVISAEVRTMNDLNLCVRADRFVLAAGGLEVARLLLASRDVQSTGIGNKHDVVGRYYMCHLAGTLGSLKLRGKSAWHGYDIAPDGVYCRRRLALSPESQRRLRVGNFIARLHHPRITDPAHRSAVLSALFLARPLIPYEYAKRLHGDDAVRAVDWLRHLSNVLRAPGQVFGFAWHLLRDRRLAQRKFPSLITPITDNRYSLDFHAEQEPRAISRVKLGMGRDEFGMPQLAIDWHYSKFDILTISRAASTLATDLAAKGVGQFSFELNEIEREATRYGAYGGHHLGTTRMGLNPRSSVVNADCRVHGVANLYVASTAVFPTSSQANPTLTLIALCLRLADHLRTKSPQKTQDNSRIATDNYGVIA